MIGGVQPKLLLKIDESSELLLDEVFMEIFDKKEDVRYKLVREKDGLSKMSANIKWLEFDEDGRYKADFGEIAIGRSLIMSPFSQFFTWQTTPVTEIIEQEKDYIKFKTENSNYKLVKITKND
jgi:hypothetical protein